MRVHAALTLTEMVSSHDSVKAAVSPQVGKVVQGSPQLRSISSNVILHYNRVDLLKLSDETDLDILNSSMETMVEHFQDELLPVAAQLTARLVCIFPFSSRDHFLRGNSASRICALYGKRLQTRRTHRRAMTWKHLWTPKVRTTRHMLRWVWRKPSARSVMIGTKSDMYNDPLQIVSSIDSSPEILAQVQEVIIPIIRFTLENKALGM